MGRSLYVDGYQLGKPSVTYLAEALRISRLADLSQWLHGTFTLFVYDKRKPLWQAMVDNAGLYHAFYDRHSVDTRFLHMLSGREVNLLSPEAAADFLGHRSIYWGRTFVHGIRKIGYNQIIELHDEFTITHKRLASKERIVRYEFANNFINLAHAVKHENVSLDLTGGLNSRLVFCLMLDQGLPFEADVIGRHDNADVVLAKQVIRRTNTLLYILEPDASNVAEELRQSISGGRRMR